MESVQIDLSLIEEENYNELKTTICFHANKETKDGVEICSDCGTELLKQLSLEPEWRFYRENDNKNSFDPSRCHLRKNEEKNIYKELEPMGFPDDIISYANELYENITKGDIKRGRYRQALLYACVYFAYKYKGVPQIPSNLSAKFKLQRKDISKGLKYFQLYCSVPKPSQMSQAQSYSNFIPEIMKYFKSSQIHIDNVVALYDKIRCKSSLLHRSNPQSVISGTIFFYFQKIGGSISCADFSSKVGLSELTIMKIVKEIVSILETKV
jgi:transcription initiation factor TFIIIB Brf1 subunit/transcription initiation factor TFIIB